MKKKLKFINGFIGIGSNLGNRQRTIKRAIQKINSHPKISVNKVSSIYETSPIGPKQPNFLNAVVEIKAQCSPWELLLVLNKIETQLGRTRRVRWGPRSIDLDILFYGKEKVKTTRLTIPHKEFSKRLFVLKPLSEIAPNYIPFGQKSTIRQMYRRLTDPHQKVKLFR